jgi:hypothetical protein
MRDMLRIGRARVVIGNRALPVRRQGAANGATGRTSGVYKSPSLLDSPYRNKTVASIHSVYTCLLRATGHAYEAHSYEGLCEDLARQNTIARLSQRQLGFTWVSVIVAVS